MSLAEFTTEPELMLSDVVRNDVGQHTRDVVATFRRGDADLFEAADLDIRSAENGLTLDAGIGTEIQTVGSRVEAVIGVVERLIEVVHSKQQLVCQGWSEYRI